MILGKNAIQDYFEQINQPYFAIFYKGQVEKGNSIFRNDKEGDGEILFADAVQDFIRKLQLLGAGTYSLVISDKRNVTTRGGFRTDFVITATEANTAATQHTPVAVSGMGLSMEEVERKAAEIAESKFQQLMEKKELAETKEKLAIAEKEKSELEKKVNDPINKFLNAAAPHSNAIISGLFGNKAQQANVVLSGTEPSEVSGPCPDAQQVCEDFVEALSAARPHDWQTILQKLTKVITTEPEKFETALKFL